MRDGSCRGFYDAVTIGSLEGWMMRTDGNGGGTRACQRIVRQDPSTTDAWGSAGGIPGGPTALAGMVLLLTSSTMGPGVHAARCLFQIKCLGALDRCYTKDVTRPGCN